MHRPVLLHEVIEYLNPAPGKIILDCTVGGGGHARAILEYISPGGTLIGIDKDDEALETAEKNLKDFKKETIFIRDDFRNLDSIFLNHKLGEVDGMLFDLGLSSLQLEEARRGFGIKKNGPLDMRMDRRLKIDAGHLVNSLNARDLAAILLKFGEEHQAGRIARAIVANRPVETTRRLADIVYNAARPRAGAVRIHPATKTFQALRIAVNGELEALEGALGAAQKHLKRGGRICVISFHSAEDRITKRSFRGYARQDMLRIITKKPITPKREEVLLNPRSRSAKLRVAEKI